MHTTSKWSLSKYVAISVFGFATFPAYIDIHIILSKLQHIQNSAARLVTGRKRGRHIDMTSLLNDLHWLPIDERVRFKILCQIFKIVNQSEIAPKYLSELITIDRPIHNTRRSVGVRFV